MAEVCVHPEAFDPAAEAAALTRGRLDVGAVVTFTGLCRDEDGRLAALELEHYPGMAEAEIARIVATAKERWPLLAVRVAHRTGMVPAGDPIVLVVTAARHRGAAFAAAEFLMDYLKTRAPFWKKEHFRDGSAGGWVAPKSSDDVATDRWLG